MAYGFMCTNPGSGDLIVSEAYPCPHFIGRASLVSGNQWQITGYAGVIPIAFVRSNGTQYAAVDAVVAGAGATWYIYTRGTPVEVLVFSPLPALASAETFGLAVFDATGKTLFDSTRKPLYIQQVADMDTAGSFYGGRAQVALVSGITTPAYLVTTGGVVRTEVWGSTFNQYQELVSVARVNGGFVQWNFNTVYTFNNTHPPEAEPPAPDPIYEDNYTSGAVFVIDSSIY